MNQSKRGLSTVGRMGFTLLESLVVIAILGILISLATIASQVALSSSRTTNCSNKLKQIGLAIQTYQSQHDVFPPGFVESGGSLGFGWPSMLLLYLDREDVYSEINFEKSLLAESNYDATHTRVESYHCPANYALSPSGPAGMAQSSFVGSSGVEDHCTGVFFRNSSIRIDDIRDGVSTTLCCLERSSQTAIRATWPGDASDGGGLVLFDSSKRPLRGESQSWGASSFHPSGINSLMADGSYRKLSFDIDDVVLRSLSTRRGAEMIGNPAE